MPNTHVQVMLFHLKAIPPIARFVLPYFNLYCVGLIHQNSMLYLGSMAEHIQML
jgi:hypothetical protein